MLLKIISKMFGNYMIVVGRNPVTVNYTFTKDTYCGIYHADRFINFMSTRGKCS